MGDEKPPIHFADVVATDADGQRRTMSLHVRLGSHPSWITVSGLARSGDYIPNIRIAARIYDRKSPDPKDKPNEMTAVVELLLPERDDAVYLFVGFDSLGRLIPAFGKPFAEYVRDARKPNWAFPCI